MKKILVIGLGGTIASVKADKIRLDDSYKILEYCKHKDINFTCYSPFNIFSENINIEYWSKLLSYMQAISFDSFDGVIILHGSDTLAYTSAIIGNAYPNEHIILVASDKPVEDETSNAISNFNAAVEHIKNGTKGVFVSYDGIKNALQITSANINDKFCTIDTSQKPNCKKSVQNKNVLIIKLYPSINFDSFNLDDVDEVLIEMYHSATAPVYVTSFIKELDRRKIAYHFVTHKASADYETAEDLSNIIFNSTIENAFANCIMK